MVDLGRRKFISLLSAVAATPACWPIATTSAQQRPRVPTIGFLGSGTPSSDSQFVAAFGQRMRALGWLEGRDVAIEYRWGEGRWIAADSQPSWCGSRWTLFSRMEARRQPRQNRRRRSFPSSSTGRAGRNWPVQAWHDGQHHRRVGSVERSEQRLGFTQSLPSLQHIAFWSISAIQRRARHG